MLGDLFSSDAEFTERKHAWRRGTTPEESVEVTIRAVARENQHIERWVPHVVWSAAEEACEELVRPERTRTLLEGRSVLELGSGTGLCGLVCGVLSKAVVLTDGSEEAVEELEKTAALNPHAHVAGCAVLWWGDVDGLGMVLGLVGGGGFDVVVGTDVVYEAEFIAPLLKSAVAALVEGGRLVLANHKFRFRAFAETIKKETGALPLVLEEHTLLHDQVDFLVFRKRQQSSSSLSSSS